MDSSFFKYVSDCELLKLYFVEELAAALDNRKTIFSLAVSWDLNITKKAGEFLCVLILN